MTNEQKFKTPEERNKAFHRYCKSVNDCSACPLGRMPMLRCTFAWLALEAEEDKPLPCPFCGSEAQVVIIAPTGVYVRCKECGAFVATFNTKADAIAAWNRRAK